MTHVISGTTLVNWDPTDTRTLADLVEEYSLTKIGDDSFEGATDPRIANLVIPEGIQSIETGAFACTPIETIKFPSSLNSIDDRAFKNCKNLTAVDFTDPQIEGIGEHAFSGCEKLAELTLPTSLQGMGILAFYGTGITSLEIPENITSIPDRAFAGCRNLVTIKLHEKLTHLGNGAFAWCTKLVDFSFPDSLDHVCGDGYHHTCEQGESDGVLEGCVALKTLKLPSGLKRTGGAEFKGCISLEKVTIPKTCTILADELFMNCKSLRSVVFEPGSELTHMGYSIFEGCDSLESVDLPGKVETVGGFTNLKGLQSITIPKSVTEINNNAFEGCANLTHLVIPSRVKIIEHSTFEGCTNLGTVSFAEYSNLKAIDMRAFKGCSNLFIALPSKLTIDRSAFEGCNNAIFILHGEDDSRLPRGDHIQIMKKADMQHIKVGAVETGNDSTLFLPDTLTSIPDWAFRGFENILSVNLPSTITHIGEGTFSGCEKLQKVTLPKGLKTIGPEAFSDCDAIKELVFNGTLDFDTHPFRSSEVITIGPDVKEIPEGAFKAFHLTSVTLHNGLEIIGNEAFQRCEYLEEINIPATVKHIGESALGECANLARISMPKGLTLGIAAFESCLKLSEVILPEDLKTIPEAAFYDCPSLAQINIPKTVTAIGKEAFKNCAALFSIDLPISVTTTTIGENAFAGCTNTVFIWRREKSDLNRDLFPTGANIIFWADLNMTERAYFTQGVTRDNMVRMCLETTSKEALAVSKLQTLLPHLSIVEINGYIAEGQSKKKAFEDHFHSLGYATGACTKNTGLSIFPAAAPEVSSAAATDTASTDRPAKEPRIIPPLSSNSLNAINQGDVLRSIATFLPQYYPPAPQGSSAENAPEMEVENAGPG